MTSIDPRSRVGLHAEARIEVVHDGSTSRCAVIQSMPPLTFRSTPAPASMHQEARLTWVGTAAGPVGGDELHLDVRVERGASLRVSSAGAALVLPGPWGGESSISTNAWVGDGASLTWCPEPTILAAGCRHRGTTRLTIGADCTIVWLEELVLGRYGEEPGSAVTRLVVDRGMDGGRTVPVLRTGLDVGAPGWRGPGGVGASTRIVSHVLLVGRRVKSFEPPDEVDAVVSDVGDDAQLITIVSRSTMHGRTFAAAVSGLVGQRCIDAWEAHAGG